MVDDPNIKTPYNVEAEEALLGSIFIKPDCLEDVMELVEPNDFYKNHYKLIFSELIGIYKTTTIIDSLVLLNSLRKKGILDEVGGEQIIYDLTDVVPTAANARTYAQIIRDNSIQRKLIDTGTKITEMAYRGYENVEDIIKKAEDMLYKISTNQNSDERISILQSVANRKERKLMGIQKSILTPYKGLNEFINFRQGWLITIGARPGMGKTAFALNLLRHTARENNVLYVNMEMENSEVIERMIAAEGNIALTLVKEESWNSIDESIRKKVELAEDKIGKLNFEQLDVTNLSFEYIINNIKKAVKEQKRDLIVVDFLQMMSQPGYQNKTYEIQYMVTRLKLLSVELNTCIVLLSQLNREVETRPGNNPIMADLKDSGAIEQASNVIILITSTDSGCGEIGTSHAKLELKIAKNRKGKTGKLNLFYNKETQNIYEEVTK